MTRTVGLLVFPDFQILDATGPVAVFEIAARFVPGAYALQLVARDPGPVTSSSGVQVLAAPMTSAPLDTLVVAGGEGTRGPAICARTLDWVRSTAAQARRTASVCSGAYILAAERGDHDVGVRQPRQHLMWPSEVEVGDARIERDDDLQLGHAASKEI